MSQKRERLGVNLRRSNPRRRLNQEHINKRLSLPADLQLPQDLLAKLSVSPTGQSDEPLSRSVRRQSLVGLSRLLFLLNLLPAPQKVAQNKKCPLSGTNLSLFLVSFVYHQSEIGFGKLETYIKLDKLGEV